MEAISQTLERFLRTGEGDFDSLSLHLFKHQYRHNPPYQAYCNGLGVAPEAVLRWQDVPAVPILAFKSAELATFPTGRAAAIFESSGTTAKTPSRHYLKTLSHYEAALSTSFRHWLLPDDVLFPFFILTPPPSAAPRSSLSWMMDVVKRRFGGVGSEYVVQNGRLDEPRLASLLTKAETAKAPIVLLGTTIAFLAFFDYCARIGKRFGLPQGSRLMDTGGMKSQKREVSRTDFVRQVGSVFGIPENLCINEYGMCEMSSQFYGRGSSTQLFGPAWVRTLVIDPETGREAGDNAVGLLRHFDLANVDSVMALQTEDMGRREGDGFVFLGRAAEADLKGCSISAESFLK